jgi:TonB family protein
MNRAGPKESVLVEFDVSSSGDTTNFRILDSTFSCLEAAAATAVRNWKYSPKIIDGLSVERRGVQTVITFELSNQLLDPPYRPEVERRLNIISASIRRGDDPGAILAEIAKLEEKYGDDFSREELKAFHQFRGAARLSARDNRGALDDLRVVAQLGISGETGEAVAKAIEQLEAAIADEDAAAQAKPGERPPESSE